MKLTIRRGGGIAGLVARTELDASDLPPPAAEMFAAHMDRSGLRTSGEPPAAVRRPDDQLYDLSWEEAGHTGSRRFSESNLPEGVRQLLAWVDGRPERIESIER